MLTFYLVLAHVDVRRRRRHIACEVVDHLVFLQPRDDWIGLEGAIVKSSKSVIVACRERLAELSAPRLNMTLSKIWHTIIHLHLHHVDPDHEHWSC
jgi:hypothetical protein